jgi:hypothetical protein
MEKEHTLYPTGKHCSSCGGEIVELFSSKTQEVTMSTPMGPLETWISSDGFSCQKCGLLYGEPVFTKTTDENVLREIKLILIISSEQTKIVKMDSSPEKKKDLSELNRSILNRTMK